jgi:hypothetical protein
MEGLILLVLVVGVWTLVLRSSPSTFERSDRIEIRIPNKRHPLIPGCILWLVGFLIIIVVVFQGATMP